jgi:4-hydroxy-2-oxoheptanedioate aldolase
MRPIDGGNADGAYGRVAVPQYVERANSERMTIVQIEDAAALEHADAIAGTPGVDIVFFGPGDFSQSVGKPGALDHPDVLTARQHVVDVATAHHKYAGTVTTGDDVADLLDMGYRLINIGSDVGALGQAFSMASAAARASGCGGRR